MIVLRINNLRVFIYIYSCALCFLHILSIRTLAFSILRREFLSRRSKSSQCELRRQNESLGRSFVDLKRGKGIRWICLDEHSYHFVCGVVV